MRHIGGAEVTSSKACQSVRPLLHLP
jgi:hypothetical protein